MATPDAVISELESGLNQPAYARGLRRGTRGDRLRLYFEPWRTTGQIGGAQERLLLPMPSRFKGGEALLCRRRHNGAATP